MKKEKIGFGEGAEIAFAIPGEPSRIEELGGRCEDWRIEE